MPFDWLNTDPIRGISFVSDNIRYNFESFLSKLFKKQDGNIVSEKYPYAEFIHEKNLIESQADRDKFSNRITRFQKLLDKKIYFLYNVTSVALSTEEQVLSLYNSALEFTKQLKTNQFLCVYIRYNEKLSENQDQCLLLANLLSKEPKVKLSHYVREMSAYGLWGRADKYPILYKELGIKIKRTFPRMYLK